MEITCDLCNSFCQQKCRQFIGKKLKVFRVPGIDKLTPFETVVIGYHLLAHSMGSMGIEIRFSRDDLELVNKEIWLPPGMRIASGNSRQLFDASIDGKTVTYCTWLHPKHSQFIF